MIKIKMIDVNMGLFNSVDFTELSEIVNGLGKDRILYITSAIRSQTNIKYTIFYEDDD